MNEDLILIVDDEEGIRESLSGILSDEGYRVAEAASAEDALEFISKETPALVLLDVWLPGMDGLAALARIKELAPATEVVMISGHGNIETALNASRSGAYDFLEKPLILDKVLLVAKNALQKLTLERENIRLKQSLGQKWVLVGESPAINQIRSQIQMAAKSNSRVLITGESGTGKEIVAHLLHEQSPRARKQFVEVNCAAIPQELIESELFGHEKGSFTGAFEQKKGKFELAHEGTLFLDEIGDMSFQTQAKLLRVLESQQFQRVGGSRNITVDARVVAATNKDMPEMIKDGMFRDDLYFRLNVIPIAMPPLRDRRPDVPLLVDHFLGQLATEYGQQKKEMSPQAMRRLMEHSWPGNIRELRNLVERLVIMTPSSTIEESHLTISSASTGGDYLSYDNLREAREAFERDFIAQKLKENGWNVSKTSEVLAIERSNLHRKIKALGINLP